MQIDATLGVLRKQRATQLLLYNRDLTQKKGTMDSEDDHSIKSMTQQQLLGECQNENSECYSSEYTNDSTANHHSEAVSVSRTLLQRNGAPSIERVWRCIGSSGGDLSEQHGRQNDIANKSYYCKEIFVESGIIVMGILGLIIFAMIMAT